MDKVALTAWLASLMYVTAYVARGMSNAIGTNLILLSDATLQGIVHAPTSLGLCVIAGHVGLNKFGKGC